MWANIERIMSVKLISLNVRGLGGSTKRRAIFNYYRQRCDVLCLQETHSQKSSEQFWKHEWGGQIIFSHGDSDARGVAVLINLKANIKIVKSFEDKEGQILACELEVGEYNFCVVCVYAPNQDCPNFFVTVAEILQNVNENRILVGDFNLVLQDIDSKNVKNNNIKSAQILRVMMEEMLLEDIWRVRNPESRRYSYMRAKPKLMARRLDFALVSMGVCDLVEECFYLPGLLTDHSAYYMCIKTSVNERGTGFWKFNCSHLRIQEFLDIMNTRLDEIINTIDRMGPIEGWEYCKYEIRKVAKAFAKERASQTEVIISQLSECILAMEEQIGEESIDVSNEAQKLLEKSKTDLDEIMFEKAKGLMFRSKCNWYEFEGKSSSYFYKLEKERYNAKTCHSLFDQNQNLITDDQHILELQRVFYEKLYSRDENVNFELTNTSEVRVTEDMREEQNKEFTYEEIAKAVLQLENEKCPGNDGLPVDFYKIFWKKLANPFMKMLKEAYERQSMPRSSMLGVINLILKANKDTRVLKNLRPITLLNIDYKVIEKALANRLIPALDLLISSDQRGFLKNRRISTNIRKIFDVITLAEQKEVDSLILSLDFEKCFDKIEFEAIYGAMQFFGVGEYVEKWTRLMYDGFSANVQNNGKFSRRFPINRSVHQGGPCSVYYFLLCAELLAISIKTEKGIKGIMIDEILNLLNQYADDADIFLLYEEQTVGKVVEVLEVFRKNTGFVVNYDKTQLYRIGSLHNTNAKFYTAVNLK